MMCVHTTRSSSRGTYKAQLKSNSSIRDAVHAQKPSRMGESGTHSSDTEMLDVTHGPCEDEGLGGAVVDKNTACDKRHNWTTEDVAMAVLCGCAGGPYMALNIPSRKSKSHAAQETNAPSDELKGHSTVLPPRKPDETMEANETGDPRMIAASHESSFKEPGLSTCSPNEFAASGMKQQGVAIEQQQQQQLPLQQQSSAAEIEDSQNRDRVSSLPSFRETLFTKLAHSPKITGRQVDGIMMPLERTNSPSPLPNADELQDLDSAFPDPETVEVSREEFFMALPPEMRVAQLEEELQRVRAEKKEEEDFKTEAGWAAYMMDLVANKRLEDTVDDLRIIEYQSQILESMMAAIQQGQGGTLEQWQDRIRPAAEAARQRLAVRSRAVGEVLCPQN